MIARVSPLVAAGMAVGIALVVAGVWCGRSRTPVVESAVNGTVLLRITRHDALGIPAKPSMLREPGRVHTIVQALGVDGHPPTPCPPDYASAELGIVLSGRDIYARRNVYVWDLFSDAGSPRVLVVNSSGCRGGPPDDAAALRRELGGTP